MGWAILSLNINRMASLGGQASILRSAKPDIVFLQACPLRDASLKSRAAGLCYVAHQSSLDPSRKLRQLVTLVKKGLRASVTDLVPGNLLGVTLGAHRFLHVHAPSDSHPSDKVPLARIFREAACSVCLAEHLSNLPFAKQALTAWLGMFQQAFFVPLSCKSFVETFS